MIILGTNSIKDTGFDVANSLRFNSASSDYLNRTIGSSTPSTTWTLSCWLKRSKLGVAQTFLSAAASSAGNNNNLNIKFKADDSLEYTIINSGSYNGRRISNRLFRDTSAWYNLIFVWDTSNGTAGDRMKVYVNGLQESSFTTTSNPSLNSTANIAGNIFTVGRPAYTSDASLDSYIAEVVLLDGTAVSDATSFGEFDEDSGIWKPIDVSGLTFGNNGFYLDFEDSSALGADVSGNTNNFTVNNLTAIDQSTDTCTNNYATGNPLDNGCGKAPTFSEGNLKYVSSSTFNFALPTIGVSSGKWYMEIKYVAVGSGGSIMAGITDQFDNTNRDLTGNAFAGGEPLGIGYYQNGNKYLNNVASSYGSTYTTGDIIGVYLDVDNSKLYFAKNGTLQNSGTGLDLPSSANSTGVFFFMPSVDKATIEVNYGNPTFTGTDKADANGYGSFKYSPSAGTFDGASKDFYALNTKNLAEYG